VGSGSWLSRLEGAKGFTRIRKRCDSRATQEDDASCNGVRQCVLLSTSSMQEGSGAHRDVEAVKGAS
jgi:hypothetical protein